MNGTPETAPSLLTSSDPHGVVADPVESARAMRLLRDAVRPEFAGDVIEVPKDHDVLTRGPCVVQGCERPISRAGNMCPGHYARWSYDIRPTGITRAEWLASGPPMVKSNNQPLSSCLVPWCGYGRDSRGMCVRHAKARRVAKISIEDQIAWGATVPVDEAVVTSAPACRLRDCELWARPSGVYCRSHDARFHLMEKRLGREVTAREFQIWVDSSGCLRLGVLHLPPRLKLEVQYSAQTYLERGSIRMQLMEWASPTHLLVATGVDSILDMSPQEWQALWMEHRPSRKSQRTFFTWTHEEVDKLVNGTGWDVEYSSDVWRTRRITTQATRVAHLSFTGIVVDWLRDLAKRYTRHRVSVGLKVATCNSAIYALTDLSDFLTARGYAPEGPEQLSREHLEEWLAHLAAEKSSTGTRASKVNAVAMFLQEVHQRGWAPGLPSTTTIFREDRPRNPKNTKARALSEYVMTQLEAGLVQVADPEWRTITEIVMRTGLRGGDVLQIDFDCVVRDGEGHPYLRYLNHKMSRTAYTPIEEDVAEHIKDQQARVIARFGKALQWLFPAKHYNASGLKAATRGGWVDSLSRWLMLIEVVDEHGQQVRFTPHQFRHTFATRLINDDVPHHIVQQLLDHTSSEMTSHYARAHSKTVHRAWSKARKINAFGEEVDLTDDHPLSDISWARAGLDQAKQTLPNGFCGMPAQSPCEHANPCLTCPLFLTTPEFLPQHQAQHRTTLELIEVARTNGHQRVVDKNEIVAHNLSRIITACQACEPDQVVAGGKVVTPGQSTHDSARSLIGEADAS